MEGKELGGTLIKEDLQIIFRSIKISTLAENCTWI